MNRLLSSIDIQFLHMNSVLLNNPYFSLCNSTKNDHLFTKMVFVDS